MILKCATIGLGQIGLTTFMIQPILNSNALETLWTFLHWPHSVADPQAGSVPWSPQGRWTLGCSWRRSWAHASLPHQALGGPPIRLLQPPSQGSAPSDGPSGGAPRLSCSPGCRLKSGACCHMLPPGGSRGTSRSRSKPVRVGDRRRNGGR